MLVQPGREPLHHDFGVVEGGMLRTRITAYRERLGHVAVRDRTRLSEKGGCQGIVEKDGAKTDQGIVRRDRPVGLNIHNKKAHGAAAAGGRSFEFWVWSFGFGVSGFRFWDESPERCNIGRQSHATTHGGTSTNDGGVTTTDGGGVTTSGEVMTTSGEVAVANGGIAADRVGSRHAEGLPRITPMNTRLRGELVGIALPHPTDSCQVVVKRG